MVGKITNVDIMTVAISRLLQDGETVFHGVSSPLPMVAIQLAKKMHAKNLVYLNIPGGTNGQMSKQNKTSTASHDLHYMMSSYVPLTEIFDLSQRGKLDVAFLSGVQFDRYGHVNASVIGDYHHPKVRLPGGAGSAVLIPTAKKPIIWRSKHDKRTFVERCDFNTTKGNIYRYVTPLCVFKMENGEVVLESIHETSSLEEVQNQTGFDIKYDQIRITPSPTSNEIRMLLQVDPTRLRYLEFDQKDIKYI
jgi:glutaconate CoA-transferase subunit B